MPESILGDIKLPNVHKLNPGESMSFEIPKSRSEDKGSILFVVDSGEREAFVSYNEDNFLNVFSIKRNGDLFVKCILQTTDYGIVIISVDEENPNHAEGTYYFFNGNTISRMEFRFYFKGSIFQGFYFYEYMCYKGEVIESTYDKDYTKLESVRMYSVTNDYDDSTLPVNSFDFDMIPSITIKRDEGKFDIVPNIDGDILVHVKSIEVNGKYRQEYLIKKRG